MPVETAGLAEEEGADKGNPVYAALARTATRGVALYFSRPVRFFRPSKVSGWHSLRGQATQTGELFNSQYLAGLFRSQGFRFVVMKHFIPPMVANAALGTVLWTTYQETSLMLSFHVESTTAVAAMSGSIAGFTYALVGAPAENIRRVVEGGGTWKSAWKEIFLDNSPEIHARKDREQARQIRRWIRDVSDMTGRGWEGWGWSCAKDMCGFAVFFTIFDVTRRLAGRIKLTAERSSKRHPGFPRIAHGMTLVAGGAFASLSYEVVCRPWENARKVIQIDSLTHSLSIKNIWLAFRRKFQQDGFRGFFQDPLAALHEQTYSSPFQRRLYGSLRTLGRVGPWGAAFLIWEAYGPGVPTHS